MSAQRQIGLALGTAQVAIRGRVADPWPVNDRVYVSVADVLESARGLGAAFEGVAL